MEKKGIIYTRQAIAQVLGISERRVGQLTKDGIVEEFSPGHYKLLPSIRAYIRYLNGQLEAKTKKTDLDLEKERLTRVKAESAELELQLKRNELHRAADVEFVMTNMLGAFKAKLATMPGKILPELMSVPDGKNRAEHLLEVLRAAAEEATNELSGYKPGIFDLTKYINPDSDGEESVKNEYYD